MTLSDLSLSSGLTYFVTVRAVDLAGNVGIQATGDGFSYNFCRSISVGGSWILVPGNPSYKAEAFCVMKYEVKNNSGTPESRSNSKPWVNINQNNARSECASLGNGSHLLTNAEWMTLASNVANVGSNWSEGFVGGGELARGHSDNNPSEICAADANDDNAYVEGSCSGSPDGDNFRERRTHRLSNSELIWDLSSNVWEWIDYNNANDRPSPYGNTFFEYTAVADTNVMDLTELIPQFAIDSNWNSNQSIGQYYPGLDNSGGALYRGGSYFFGDASGVFNAAMELTSTSTGPDIGFRCAIDIP